MFSEERNGHEEDIDEWENKNKLARPWSGENPDFPFRYIGFGQLYYEDYGQSQDQDQDGGESIIGKLVDDSAKMELYYKNK